MDFEKGESFALPNSQSYLFSLSISAHSTSYILTSEDEIDSDLLRYLFEKKQNHFHYGWIPTNRKMH